MGFFIKSHLIWIRMGRKIQFYDKGIIIDLIIKTLFKLILLNFLWENILIENTVVLWNVNSYKIYIGASILLSSLLTYPNVYYTSMEIQNGSIINTLSKPVYYPLVIFFKNIGIGMSNLLIVGPLIVIYFLSNGVSVFPIRIFYFLISGFLGFITYILIDIVFSLMTFWLVNSWGISLMKGAIYSIFTGSLLPLDLYPQGIRKYIEASPFPGIVYKPILILNNSSQFCFKDTFFQIFWIIVISNIIFIVFKRAKLSLEALGG